MKKIIKIISTSFLLLSLNFLNLVNAKEKIKIGLLVPMTGKNKDLGESIIKAASLAVKDIDNNLIEIYPKDTATRANQTLKSAFELKQMGIKIIIGPIFHESLTYLDEMKDLTFLSLTNKTLDLPENVISAGINSTSQFNTIKKFLDNNNLQKTLFLTPIQNFEFEVKDGLRNSKIKVFKNISQNWVQVGDDINGENLNHLGTYIDIEEDSNGFLTLAASGTKENGESYVNVYKLFGSDWISFAGFDSTDNQGFPTSSLDISNNGRFLVTGTSHSPVNSTNYDDNFLSAGYIGFNEKTGRRSQKEIKTPHKTQKKEP